MKPIKPIRVEIINTQTIGAMAGYGEGSTLALAQADAMVKARRIDADAKLSASGWQVYVRGGINS